MWLSWKHLNRITSTSLTSRKKTTKTSHHIPHLLPAIYGFSAMLSFPNIACFTRIFLQFLHLLSQLRQATADLWEASSRQHLSEVSPPSGDEKFVTFFGMVSSHVTLFVRGCWWPTQRLGMKQKSRIESPGSKKHHTLLNKLNPATLLSLGPKYHQPSSHRFWELFNPMF